jgi:hypothetical protein
VRLEDARRVDLERGRRESTDEQGTPATLKPSFLAEEPRLPLPFWPRRPGGRLPRLVLLVEPAVDEGPDQGAGRNTASEALAPQARVDSFFEAHRQRLSQGSHLRPQPYTSRPPPATDRSGQTRYPDGDGLRPSWLRARRGAADENLGVVWSGRGVLRKPGPSRNLRGARVSLLRSRSALCL